MIGVILCVYSLYFSYFTTNTDYVYYPRENVIGKKNTGKPKSPLEDQRKRKKPPLSHWITCRYKRMRLVVQASGSIPFPTIQNCKINTQKYTKKYLAVNYQLYYTT